MFFFLKKFFASLNNERNTSLKKSFAKLKIYNWRRTKRKLLQTTIIDGKVSQPQQAIETNYFG